MWLTTSRFALIVAAAAGLAVSMVVLPALALPADAAVPGQNGEIVFAGDAMTAVTPGGAAREVLPGEAPALDVSPDGRVVLFSTLDATIEVVSMAGGPRQVLVTGENTFNDVAWSPDGSQFAVTDGNEVTVHAADGTNPRVVATRDDLIGTTGLFESITWTTAGHIYAAAFGRVLIIDPADGSIQMVVTGRSSTGYDLVDERGIDGSPDGGRLVVTCFIRDASDESILQLCILDTGLTLIGTINTTAAGVRAEFAGFSPDGSRIAFNGADMNAEFARRLYTVAVDGSGLTAVAEGSLDRADWAVAPRTPPEPLEEPPPPPSNEPLGCGGFDGDPATTERADFTDPVLYAVAVSQARFGCDADAAHVVLSRDDAFADSLVGAALTGDGPLMFTQTDSLPQATAAEIDRVLDDGGTVYLLGGTAAISQAVEDQLAADHGVVRLAGPSRVETSVRVAEETLALGGDGDTVAVARAGGPAENPTAAWADSVSAGAWTAAERIPTVVTDTASLHPAVATFLSDTDPSATVLLGGTAALSQAVEAAVPGPRRIAGDSRDATAEEIAEVLIGLDDGERSLVMVNGYRADGWLFGLPATGLAADAEGAIALAQDLVPPATLSLACDPDEVDVLLAGGFGILPAVVVAQLDDAGGC